MLKIIKKIIINLFLQIKILQKSFKISAKEDIKVNDHCHITGKYKGSANK